MHFLPSEKNVILYIAWSLYTLHYIAAIDDYSKSLVTASQQMTRVGGFLLMTVISLHSLYIRVVSI